MNKTVAILTFLLFISFTSNYFSPLPQSSETDAWRNKVDHWVLETTANGAETEFLIYLTEQADLSAVDDLTTKIEKGSFVFQELTAVAQRTQSPVISDLRAQGVTEIQPFWVTNMILAKGNVTVLQAMAERKDVAHIYANPTVSISRLPLVTETELINSAMSVEWNISHVNAPDVWSAGYTGQGIVIGGQDTGYDWEHPALINQYRGWDGTNADHDFNWHDAIHSGGGVCGADSPMPCDDNNHGTHTMGTMVGDDGGSNQVGMAPGARWIGCRNMDQGNGTPATYSECYQWFIAPYPIGGDPINDADPSMAPHVINNSWSCPASEGCSANTLLAVVQNVHSAGIVTVHSAGNSGSGCSTVNAPAGIYDESYSVGATNSSDAIAGFSSRGPVTVDGSNRLKPDISAPGVNIRSTVPGGGYQGGWQGTSMASPHVAGLIGLILSAQPSLAGQVDDIEALINSSALPRTSSQGCGGDAPTDVPNNVYGHGRIDAWAAYQNLPRHALEIEKTANAPAVVAGELLSYTLTVTHTHPTSDTYNLVLTDTIPAGTTFVTATLPHLFQNNVVQWEKASLAANTSWSTQLVVQVDLDSSGSITNSLYGVSSDEVIAVSGADLVTPILFYDMVITKTAVSEVFRGDNISYTLTVNNPISGSLLHNLVLSDVLPANTTFITATTPHSFDGSMVEWELATLDSGDIWEVQFVVQVPTTFSGEIVENVIYGVLSDEIPMPITGSTVTTTLLWHDLYIPLIYKD